MTVRGLGSKSVRSAGVRPGLKHFYRPVWTVPAWDEFVRGHTIGTVGQVCPGASMIGVFRVDLTEQAPGMNLKGDMLHLPIRSKSVDTICCDPPYELAYDKRVYLQRELCRVARKRIILKAPWILRGGGFRLKVTVLLCSHSCQNVSVLSMMERAEDEPELFETDGR